MIWDSNIFFPCISLKTMGFIYALAYTADVVLSFAQQ